MKAEGEVPETTKSDNELIADFMGWVWPKDPDHKRYEITSLKYHVSWDWLMSVVEKVNKTVLGQFIPWADVQYSLREANIQVVYERVVAAIKWHNQQKP